MCRVDHILLEQMPSNQRWEDTNPESIYMSIPSREVSPLHLALTYSVFMLTAFTESLHFLLLQTFEKGTVSPPSPSTHVCWNKKKKKITCLAGQNWHSVQMSKQLKPCLTLPVPSLTFPISATSRTVGGGGCQWWVMKDWAVQTRVPSWRCEETHTWIHHEVQLNTAL